MSPLRLLEGVFSWVLLNTSSLFQPGRNDHFCYFDDNNQYEELIRLQNNLSIETSLYTVGYMKTNLYFQKSSKVTYI